MDYAIFDSLSVGVFIINREGLIVYTNEAGAAMGDSSVKRLVSKKTISQVFAFENVDLFFYGQGSLGLDQPVPLTEMSFKLLGKNRTGKVQLSLQPFNAGERKWVISLHDVTLEETLHRKYQGQLKDMEVVISELKEVRGQLEIYSRNLEKMVEDRTLALKSANRSLAAIMDSLGQGFLIFDKHGICGDVFTKACSEILEGAPSGKSIVDVLRLAGESKDLFYQWMEVTFGESLPFESLVELAPRIYPHSKGRHVTLDYFPIRTDDGSLSHLVLVATDKTSEHLAQQELEREKRFADMILKMVRNREDFRQFLKSAKNTIKNLLQYLESPKLASIDMAEVFRVLHTLEGEAAAFSLWDLKDHSRASQEILEKVKTAENEQRAMIYAELIASVTNMQAAFEHFLSRNSDLLSSLHMTSEESVDISFSQLKHFNEMLKNNNSLRLGAFFENQFLLSSPKDCLKRYQGLVDSVASRLGKKVNPIHFDCGLVRVDRFFLEPLFGSMVHVFRNMVDHGIESPQERRKKGKSEEGNLSVKFEDSSKRPGWIRIEIRDDGAGMDLEILKDKAIKKGFIRADQTLSDNEILQLVFINGFSSRDSVEEFSGRGVGLDALRSEVEKLGGSVNAKSTKDIETIFILECPKTSLTSIESVAS